MVDEKVFYFRFFVFFRGPDPLCQGPIRRGPSRRVGHIRPGSTSERVETDTGPLYEGDGGASIGGLAVLAPTSEGDVAPYLPVYIQGLLNNNFRKYSGIILIDRQNLDAVLKDQDLAASGRFSDKDYVKIGNNTNSRYLLFGRIQKISGGMYSLQLSITESSTGESRATFMKNGTLSQIEQSGALINEATADLLSQMGVRLTPSGKKSLLAGNASAVQAETGLARGIVAQAGGESVAALFSYTQAVTFDPSQSDILSRLNTVSTSISGGTVSQRIVNDLQLRDRWLEVFRETAAFFKDHPPFEIVFDPNLFQAGETDFKRRTANIGMRVSLTPSEAGFRTLNTLIDGLAKTTRRDAWGFSGWPFQNLTPSEPGTVVFEGKPKFSFRLDVTLLNEKGKKLGQGSVTLESGEILRSNVGSNRIAPPQGDRDEVVFLNIRAEDLTPTLTIVINSVNDIPAETLSSTGYMRIEAGDKETA